jgi:hypothetical protein
VKIRRDLLETKVVFFVAMGAADLVQVLPFCLLFREVGDPMATTGRERNHGDKQNKSEIGWRIHGLDGPGFTGMTQIRPGNP